MIILKLYKEDHLDKKKAICAKPFLYFLCKLFRTNDIHCIKIKVRLLSLSHFNIHMKFKKTANFSKSLNFLVCSK
jgi:hypothetical protein